MIGTPLIRALVVSAAALAGALTPGRSLGEDGNQSPAKATQELPAKATKELPPELLSLLRQKKYAQTFADPCAHFQGRGGTRSLEEGRHRPFPDGQDLSDLSVVGRSWPEAA